MSWICLAASRAGIVAPAAACGTPTLAPTRVFAAAVPAAPATLTSLVDRNMVTLTWVAPSASDPVASYIVEAGSSSGLSDLASFDTGSTTPLLVVTSVPNGTYFVRVRARNGAGIGSASNEIVVVVQGTTVPGPAPCTVAPDAPTGLAGSVSASTIGFTWNAALTGCPSSSYLVEAGSAPGSRDLANVPNGSTGFTASNVPPGTYYARVRAVNTFGVSPASGELKVAVGGPPGAPCGLAYTPSNSRPSIRWNAPEACVPPTVSDPATSYVIEISDSPGGIDFMIEVQTTSYTDTPNGRLDGRGYVRVKARNRYGTSLASNEVRYDNHAN